MFGIDELNPAESASFYNFWQNATVAGPQGQAPGTGLQDHYIGALAALARRFQGDAGVLGYELMNEPQPGSIGSTPAGNGYQASSQDLYPFYTRAIEALTGVRDGRPTCPATHRLPCRARAPTLSWRRSTGNRSSSSRSPTGTWWTSRSRCPHPSRPYPNLVFAPHVYTYAFTVEQDLLGLPAKPGGYPPNFTFGYQTAESEAQAMHSAVLVTEFGDAASTDPTILANELAAQEATQIGGTLWAWKGLSKTRGRVGAPAGSTRATRRRPTARQARAIPNQRPRPADLLIPSRQRLLMRVSPIATAGRLDAYAYDPATRTFAMLATSTAAGRRGDHRTDTVLSIPSTVHGAVHVSGAAVLDSVVTRADGSRMAFVTTTLPGSAVPHRRATASPSVRRRPP